MRARAIGLGLVAAIVSVALPQQAQAGGFEYPAPGTRALGRGGAFYARADDGMALFYNPANLAGLSGNQLMVNSHLGWFDACYQRRSGPTNTYTDGQLGAFPSRFGAPDDIALETWPEVCNEAFPEFSPDLVFTTRLSPDLGLGFGLVAPAGVGSGAWGDEDGTVTNAAGRVLPSPSRYQVVRQHLLMAFPSVGIGWRALPWLRIGATLQWGFAHLSYEAYVVATRGESPATDVRAELTANDLFVPGAVLSAHFIPHDNLDIMVGFRWADDIDATADTSLEYANYGTGDPDTLMPADSTVPTRNEYPDGGIFAPTPWVLSLGIRYADRIAPRPTDPAEVERLSGRVEDSMANEWWDVELDVTYERSSRVTELGIDLPDTATLHTRDLQLGSLVEDDLILPDYIHHPHGWKDQLSVRLGGDYNVIPGLAAVRLGFSFESSGVNVPTTSIDFIPGQRFGVHGGLTVRLGRWDISLAYAHLFQKTIEVSVDEAALPQISADEMGRFTNAGRYEVNFDVLSLGVAWHI